MKSTIALALAFLATSSLAFAHVEPGTYVGKTASGETCTMIAVEQHFEGGMPHPLNERVTLTVQGETFVVGHPPVVDASKSKAFFNHDIFQGVKPTSKGAMALVLEMSHAEDAEGPTGFHFINHEWRNDTRNAVYCQGLKLTQ